MFECKKIVLVLTGLFCFGTAMPAAAETEEAVLLKVHNVVPLKDGSNQTIGCEFNTTIYNRSNANINDITVELKWLDETTRNTAANATKKPLSATTSHRRRFRKTQSFQPLTSRRYRHSAKKQSNQKSTAPIAFC